MYRAVILAAACVALALGPASLFASGGPIVYPEEPKAAYAHDLGPWPFEHGGGAVSNINPMPWYWHPDQNLTNVAGIKFTLKYDPYEVDILGIQPGPIIPGGLVGTYHFDAPGPMPETYGTSVPASSVPAMLGGTVWLPPSIRDATGTDLMASQVYSILAVSYAPKHTSHYSDPQFNTEVDLVISELRPIFHPPAQHVATVSLYEEKHAATTITHGGGQVLPSEFYWSRRHVSSESFVIVPASNTIIQPSDVSGLHLSTITIPPSVWIHEEPYTDWYHLATPVTITQFYFSESVFVVGATVAGDHLGMGIDHVPEPVTMGLLGLGGVALVRHASLRRRRRA
jgi:hypothetical protein